MTKTFRSIVVGSIGLLVVVATLAAQPPQTPVTHELLLQLDTVQSGADITLLGNLHTVKGAFLVETRRHSLRSHNQQGQRRNRVRRHQRQDRQRLA